MSRLDCNTMRAVPIRELSNPRYLPALQEFAGEVAPFCVAEALLKRFADENLTERQRFEQIQIDIVMRRTRCDRQAAVDYLESEDWDEVDAAISFLRDQKLV